MSFIIGTIVGAVVLLALDMRAHARIAALEAKIKALIGEA
jgi:hypothetical protein